MIIGTQKKNRHHSSGVTQFSFGNTPTAQPGFSRDRSGEHTDDQAQSQENGCNDYMNRLAILHFSSPFPFR
jgi:hypothetical protein